MKILQRCPFSVRRHVGLILAVMACLVMRPNVGAAQAPAADTLTASQIVDRLVEKNTERANALKQYQGRRSYWLDYKGLLGDAHAEMIVDMRYQAPSTKEFTVVSESGSKWIIEHIFKRLLESEREAMNSENLKRTALNNENYDFTMAADQDGGDQYILDVKPKAPSKFLYVGRIWVDSRDFAVRQIEAQPARNPSFWITGTAIHYTYRKIGDFWLPAETATTSTLRLSGHATLIIKYQDYKITEVLSLGRNHATPPAARP